MNIIWTSETHTPKQVTVGDVMVIEASGSVRKDEQLFLCYQSAHFKHMLPGEIQKSAAQKGTAGWGFECACTVCSRLEGRGKDVDAARLLLGREVRETARARARERESVCERECVCVCVCESYFESYFDSSHQP